MSFTRQRHYEEEKKKRKKIKNQYPSGHRWKFYTKFSKLTTTMYKKDKTSWPNWVYPRNARLFYIWKLIDIIHPINRKFKRILYDLSNRHRQCFFEKS